MNDHEDPFSPANGAEASPCYALVPVLPKKPKRKYMSLPFLKKAGYIFLSMVLCFTSGFVGVLYGIRYAADDKPGENVILSTEDLNALCIPYVGITFTDANSDRAGALILFVNPGSPAEIIGMQAGDIITSVNGTQLADSAQLDKVLSEAFIGDVFVFTILRDGVITALELTVGASEPPISPEDAPPQISI